MIAQTSLMLKDMGLAFEPGNHIHSINGTKVPGCTTVSGMLPKGWLAPWAAKEATEYVLAELAKINEREDMLPYDYAVEIVKKGKNAWRNKRDVAAGNGTRAHELIEAWIKTGQEPLMPLETPEVQNAVRLFFEWEQKHRVVWMSSELQVGSRKHMFAGILDFLAVVDGRVMLGDFKTSSGIHPEYYVQTAGLQIALEEMGGPQIEERLILHIPKTGDDFEDRIVPTPIAHDKELFLSALQFWRYSQRLENACKQYEEQNKRRTHE